jgi:hypothetical protein
VIGTATVYDLMEERMRHFIAYHSPTKMGYQYTASQGQKESVFTNKPVQHVVGNVVWVVTFRDKRDYSLASVFEVSDWDDNGKAGFKHRISGKGHPFQPWKAIKHLSWFPKLLRATGNFGLGLQEVSNPEVVAGLVEIASRDGYDLKP